jgi:hypothetical protein
MCFNQWAGIELLVAKKEPVTTIHKQSENVYSVNAVDKNTVSRWVSQCVGSKKDHAQLNDMHHSGQPATAVTQALLQHADKLI